MVRYVHLNPVRAGVIRRPGALDEYPFTGHAVIMGRREPPTQDVGEGLFRFGGRWDYRRFVIEGFDGGARPEFRGGGLLRRVGG